MRMFYRMSCVFLLIAGLLGCSALVVVKEGTKNLDIGTVIQKASIPTEKSRVESDTVCNTVGIVINISNYLEMKTQRSVDTGPHFTVHTTLMRNEEFVYQEVGDKIMSMFKAVDIDAFVVHDQNDSRLRDVCYLLHVCYDEEPKNPWLTDATSDVCITRRGMAVPDDMVIRIYYNVVVIDVKRGEKKNYYKLETAIFAIKDMLKK